MTSESGEYGNHWERKSPTSEDGGSNADNQENVEQDGYNKRMAEYQENSRSARASNIYGGESDADRFVTSASQDYRPAAGFSANDDRRGPSRRLHDSHFLLGNQLHLQEQGGNHKEPNQRYNERYANRSLESTNVGETAGHSMEDENAARDDENAKEHEREAEEGGDEADGAKEQPLHEQEHENQEYNEEDENEENASMKSNMSEASQREQERDNYDKQHDIDLEIGAKASAGRNDHRHFESEKSMPWLRMIPGDKNLSEQMFLYLTHNELKGQIQDLEKRENQAASKHQWDEALRLRDMRNRLDLARERNLYRREDLLMNPAMKKIGMANIEARSKLLKKRENLCTNSSMYSEEAKALWSEWLIEDKETVYEDARLLREDVMLELEENWRSLAVEDKQKISDSFHREIIDPAMGQDRENAEACRKASR